MKLFWCNYYSVCHKILRDAGGGGGGEDFWTATTAFLVTDKKVVWGTKLGYVHRVGVSSQNAAFLTEKFSFQQNVKPVNTKGYTREY